MICLKLQFSCLLSYMAEMNFVFCSLWRINPYSSAHQIFKAELCLSYQSLFNARSLWGFDDSPRRMGKNMEKVDPWMTHMPRFCVIYIYILYYTQCIYVSSLEWIRRHAACYIILELAKTRQHVSTHFF